MAEPEHPHPEQDPADEQGEQWHGVHSDEQALREPRRSPGGDDAHPSSPELLIEIPHLVAMSTLAGGRP